MEKSEALRLADAIDPFVRPYAPDHLTSKVAAAELRRLSAVEAQRDALLEACRFYASMMGRRKSDGEPFYMTALDFDCGDRARAAIKAVEEGR